MKERGRSLILTFSGTEVKRVFFYCLFLQTDICFLGWEIFAKETTTAKQQPLWSNKASITE